MFPTNPFPQLTTSLHLSPPPPVIFGSEGDHFLLLHHHHRDLLLQQPTPVMYDNIKEIMHINNSDTNFLARTKLPPKRDRHSKIYTAQGPRDRRVRLSIGIARKFFDLQDTLGFDKASQTLDWLLNKSKVAIKDLVRSKLGCTSTSRSNIAKCRTLTAIYESDDDVDPLEKNNVELEEDGKMITEKRLRSKQKTEKSALDLAAKESRAKARARARERTLEKMRFRNEMKKFCAPPPPHLHHYHNEGNRIGQCGPPVLNWEIGSNPRFNQSTVAESLDYGKSWEIMYNNQIN